MKRWRCAAIVANYGRMLQLTFPAGFIVSRLTTKTDKLSSGSLWLHEIKLMDLGLCPERGSASAAPQPSWQ
jgi:hypothetical protein